ncbi:MAG: hypothetical protein RQ783_08520 [Gammaproteobacteria bacterium]|nr:hypothetical protein [Gammaproteobacteria bacterium]
MTFSSDLNRIVKKTNSKFDKLFRFVTIEALSSVVRLSPVGNPSLWQTKYPPTGYVGGRFRGNWQVSINQPATSELNTFDKTGAATISKGTKEANQLKAGQTSFVVNNLAYARKLEYGGVGNGGSSQAPNGMVRITAARLKHSIKKEAARLNKK